MIVGNHREKKVVMEKKKLVKIQIQEKKKI